MNVCNVECVHSYLALITAQLKKEEKKRHSHVSQLLGTDKSKENATVQGFLVQSYLSQPNLYALVSGEKYVGV